VASFVVGSSREVSDGGYVVTLIHGNSRIYVIVQNLIRGLKLNQTPQCITGKLAKQASLGF